MSEIKVKKIGLPILSVHSRFEKNLERKERVKRKTKEEERKNLAAASALILKDRADLLPQDALFSKSFLELPSLEELAEAQGGKPKEEVLLEKIGLNFAKAIAFAAVIKRDGEWFIAFCPEIPEAKGRGKTKEEARKSLADGIALILMERADSLPQGGLFSQNFWESPSLEELAKAQGVKPMKDASEIIGTWPGEVDDGFEEWIDELRHPGRKGSDRS